MQPLIPLRCQRLAFCCEHNKHTKNSGSAALLGRYWASFGIGYIDIDLGKLCYPIGITLVPKLDKLSIISPSVHPFLAPKKCQEFQRFLYFPILHHFCEISLPLIGSLIIHVGDSLPRFFVTANRYLQKWDQSQGTVKLVKLSWCLNKQSCHNHVSMPTGKTSTTHAQY